MKFSICLIELEGYRYSHFLYDSCKYLCYSIETIGYDCCIVKNRFYSDRVNIILGAHYIHDHAIADQIRQSGKFVILQSELLREGGIAGWPDQPSFKNIFVPLMRNAIAVWDGIEANRPVIAKLGLQAEWIPRFGYLSQLEEISHKKNKDIDFLYYGSLTPHRKKLIDELKARGGNVVCLFDEAAIFRNDYIARTRVHLAPKQSPSANQIPTRILYLINNRSVVVVERCQDQKWIENCYLSEDTDHWADLCVETLKRPDLDQLAEQYFENFKKLDLTGLFQPLIDKLLEKQRMIAIPSPGIDNEKKHIGNDVDIDKSMTPDFKENVIPGLTSIIILTHNRLEQTKKCVKSIRKHTPEEHEIIFVDNSSIDNTVRWLQSQIRENKNYRLIENKEDTGFARGCNQGILASRGEFILLLENDVVVGQGWLSGLLSCLNHAPQVGIIGPMTNSADGLQGIADASYRGADYLEKFAAVFMEKYRHRRIASRNLAGFCLLFNRKLAEDIGVFDEKLKFGDIIAEDFCLRAEMDGYKNYVSGDVFVHRFAERSDMGMGILDDRKIFKEKWMLSMSEPDGKKLAVLKAIQLADAFYAQGKIDKAMETMIDCIKYSPDEPLVYYELARYFLETKKFAEARDVAASMPDEVKNSLKGLECAAYAQEGLGADEEANELAGQMLSLDENNPAAVNLLGVLAFKKGERDAARKYFEQATVVDPSYGEALTNLGVSHWSSESREEGFKYLKKGFALSPSVPDASTLYYSAVSSLNLFCEAEADFAAAWRLYPQNKSLLFLYIDILIQQKKFNEAMLKIEDALTTAGADEGIIAAALAMREKIGPRQIDMPGKKGTISLCMIVKNEEEYLAKCLLSVRDVVDEMIIIDTGSEDKTIDIARVFGAFVYDFPWTGDFSEARNQSLKHATGEWALILDADEVISPSDHGELKALVSKKGKGPVAFSIVTRNYVNNMAFVGWQANSGEYSEEAGAGWLPSPKVRLAPLRKDVFFSNPVHELLEPSLEAQKIPVYPAKIVVHHYGKLDTAKDERKGEDYYLLGKIKYESDPENAVYIYELAKQSTVLKKNTEAEELWQKLLVTLERKEETESYRKVSNLTQGNPIGEIYTQLAYIYLETGKYEQALASATIAMSCPKRQRTDVYIYTWCEMIAGNAEKAAEALEALLADAPDYLPALAVDFALLIIRGKEEEATERLDYFRRKNFSIRGSINKFARQLSSFGRKDEALKLLTFLTNSNAGDADTFKLLEEIKAAGEHQNGIVFSLD